MSTSTFLYLSNNVPRIFLLGYFSLAGLEVVVLKVQEADGGQDHHTSPEANGAVLLPSHQVQHGKNVEAHLRLKDQNIEGFLHNLLAIQDAATPSPLHHLLEANIMHCHLAHLPESISINISIRSSLSYPLLYELFGLPLIVWNRYHMVEISFPILMKLKTMSQKYILVLFV